MVTREAMLTGWLRVCNEASSMEDAAERLGMSLNALERGLERARAAGDDRAERPEGLPRRDNVAPRENPAQHRHQVAAAWLALPEEAKTTHAEAAKHLGVTAGALASILSRCRRDGVLDHTTRREPVAPPPSPAHRPPAFTDDEDYLLEEWSFLRDAGTFWESAADRLDVDRNTFALLLSRARAAHDPRGALTNEDALHLRRYAA